MRTLTLPPRHHFLSSQERWKTNLVVKRYHFYIGCQEWCQVLKIDVYALYVTRARVRCCYLSISLQSEQSEGFTAL